MPSDTPARPEEAIARVRLLADALGRASGTGAKTLQLRMVRSQADANAAAFRALLAYADALKNANQYHADRANLAEQERNTALDELAALRERLVRAEADTARLDWLAERYTDYDRWLGTYYADYGFADLRKSVDAARRPDSTEGTPDPTPARLPGDAQG